MTDARPDITGFSRPLIGPASSSRAPGGGVRRALSGAALLALAALTLPGSVQAATITFGSTLAAPATIAEAHGADAAFWPLALAGGGTVQAPASGQIVAIRLKGMALANPRPGAPAPLTQVHFQDLRPQSDGSVLVGVTTAGFDVPSSGDPNQVSTFAPVNFCVAQGDWVDFNDEGGFDPTYYPQGVPFQVFGRVPGSVTDFYTKSAGTKNRAQFTGAPNQGEELLVQMELATGPDATPLCPGGGAKAGGPPGSSPGPRDSSTRGTSAASVFVPSQTDRVTPRGSFNASVICHATVTCTGQATASSPPTAGVARRRKRPVRFSVSASFSLAPGTTGRVFLQLPAAAARAVRKRRRLRATLSATGVSGVSQTTDRASILLRRGKHR